jgi:uncharacterized damage-inducible protein DinB
MYRHLEDFLSAYGHESQTTARVIGALDNSKLNAEKAPGDTSAAELAWHIATAPAYMINHEGANIEFAYQPPANVTVEQLTAEYNRINSEVVKACQEKLADADLTRPAKWFGYELPLGVWLNMIPNHEVHHRGQLSAIMRNSGLKVPSIYGPNKEEFEEMMKNQTLPGQTGAAE